MVMAKTKTRTIAEVCADCSASEPSWASVNRGVYMCNECAGVHRNLGRHVSQVKHLHRSDWHPNQLSMVNQLVSVGANSIWEHSLLDPAQMRSGKRKPNPNDSVHPTKSDFIRAKYEQLSFVHRPPRRDDEDLGKQLHSSVRTANLDTSLRLLSLGAQANFFHTERGNTPLHVAAKAGQSLQVELLVTYGADPVGLDMNKQTPESLARAEGHIELADRLVELQYELSDRMSKFIWGHKPDHKQKGHYSLPKTRDNGVGVDGRKRLQALSNQIFEELAMDVYDEIDRRETEQLWQEAKHVGGKASSADHVAVPFLPLHPEYSSTRNQGRQKLARFTEAELAVLVTDILYDIVRRQSVSGGLDNVNPMNHDSIEEDPIYDLPPDENQHHRPIENPAATRPTQPQATIPIEEFLELKQQLADAQENMTALQEENRDLINKVTNLARKNSELLKQKHQSVVNQSAVKLPTAKLQLDARSVNKRPTSVFNANDPHGSRSSRESLESHEQRRRTIHETQHGEIVPEKHPTTRHHSSSEEQETDKMKKCPGFRADGLHDSVGSDYDNTGAAEQARKKETSSASDGANKKPTSPPESLNTNESNNTVLEKTSLVDPSPAPPSANVKPPTSEKVLELSAGAKHLPKSEEVIRKTETITKNISNLLQAAQKGKIENYLSCSENILLAVEEKILLFPEDPGNSELAAVIVSLKSSAEKLQSRCKKVSEEDAAVKSKQVTEEIIRNAYDIAKAAKELVTMTTKLQLANATISSS